MYNIQTYTTQKTYYENELLPCTDMRIKYESIVSPVARRYTRVVNGRERLEVCLSEYLPLRNVYILVVKVEPEASEGFVSRRDHESPFLF